MFSEYVETALARAEYKVIEDDEPYFASVPELPGVWASGKTVEECRKELIEVIEEWIVARLQRGLPISPDGRAQDRRCRWTGLCSPRIRQRESMQDAFLR